MGAPDETINKGHSMLNFFISMNNVSYLLSGGVIINLIYQIDQRGLFFDKETYKIL